MHNLKATKRIYWIKSGLKSYYPIIKDNAIVFSDIKNFAE